MEQQSRSPEGSQVKECAWRPLQVVSCKVAVVLVEVLQGCCGVGVGQSPVEECAWRPQ